jgi:1-aminocyclopropane-1-carboxylate deaminase/D-cysteine desulfhydrase-like pyridoxal-dependent ACC family enzyme
MHPSASHDAALRRLRTIPTIPLIRGATPVDEMVRLRMELGGGPRLLVKRDDAIPFGFGGNKVRKLELVAAQALAAGADTLITVGCVQSNHARATAAVAARLGLRCVLVANGDKPARLTGNALLNSLLGAEMIYVGSRAERLPGAHAAAERIGAEGGHPFVIPLGASTSLGALGFVRAVGELLEQVSSPPDVIVHACSSGGTQAGLVAGTRLHGLDTQVVGISADDSATDIVNTVTSIVSGIGDLLGFDGQALAASAPIMADDTFIGDGYGISTDASREAQRLAGRCEALFVDHTYTAKALAALVAFVRDGRVGAEQTVLFWHTGGQAGLFA